MTTAAQFQPDETVSYSARSCPKCSTSMTHARSALGRMIWECPACGKREK